MMNLVKTALIILGVIGMYYVMMLSFFAIQGGDEAWTAGEEDLAVMFYGVALGVNYLAALYWFALGRIKKRKLPRFK